MLMTEWNWDDAKKVWQEEAREEGITQGIAQGIEQGIEQIAYKMIKRSHPYNRD